MFSLAPTQSVETETLSALERSVIAEMRRIDKSCRRCQIIVNRNADGSWQVFEAKPAARVSPSDPLPPCCAG